MKQVAVIDELEEDEKTEFSFEELSPEAQETVIENIRNSENYLDYDWWDSAYDMIQEDMNDTGFENIKISFSGFWSQGDGACFDAEIDASVFIEKWKKDFWPLGWIVDSEDFNFSIKKNDWSHHYCHYNTRYVDYEINSNLMDSAANLKPFQFEILRGLGGDDYLCDLVKQLAGAIEEEREKWCKDIYRILENEYDGLMSDEAIKEHIEAQDNLYDEYGEEI